MGEYEVILTPEAENDLEELTQYIACNLNSPEIAFDFVERIRVEFAKLRSLPNRHAYTRQEPWRSRGVRMMPFHGFEIFYLVFDNEKVVRVQNVICERRDIPTVLAKLYPEIF